MDGCFSISHRDTPNGRVFYVHLDNMTWGPFFDLEVLWVWLTTDTATLH